MAGLDPNLQLKAHEHGCNDLSAAFKVAGQVERAQEATKICSPAFNVQLMLPSSSFIKNLRDTMMGSKVADIFQQGQKDTEKCEQFITDMEGAKVSL